MTTDTQTTHSRAWGGPALTGRIKTCPEDFIVEEVLGFAPSGDGEHVLLRIMNDHLNSMDVARRIAKAFGVRERDVGLCGLKDRHARTTQWFSAPAPAGSQPAWDRLTGEGMAVLEWGRHRKKLRRGIHAGNRFTLNVRDVNGDTGALAGVMDRIVCGGVPNYFGAQRFGHDNLRRAKAWFAGSARVGRTEKGLLLSAVRSRMFNEVLDARVRSGDWDRLGAGDVANLDGSNSIFQVHTPDADLAARLAAQDIHPTGPLYGAGDNPASGVPLQWEESVFARHPLWCEGLIRHGVGMGRRALRARVADLTWALMDNAVLRVAFFLGRGSYATVILSEIVKLETSE